MNHHIHQALVVRRGIVFVQEIKLLVKENQTAKKVKPNSFLFNIEMNNIIVVVVIIGDGKKRSPTEGDGKTNSSSNNSKKSTRREELLKQLRAVEDAIARKRSKIN